MSNLARLAGTAARLAMRHGPRLVRELQRSRALSAGGRGASAPGRAPKRAETKPTTDVAPTLHSGARSLDYRPDLDGAADPGEIVWTLVPYEEDASRGKDRPVLVVGRDGSTLLGLMLSSQVERDGQPDWHSLGAGDWDAEGRPSWVRLDRVITVDETGIRREGAVLDRRRFDQVAAILRTRYSWR
jgi:hypothetical protein